MKNFEGTEVTVTQEDIDNGIRVDCYRCPVALAISRATGRTVNTYEIAWIFEEGITTITAREEHSRSVGYDLPDEVSHFVARFDQHEKVNPFSFKIGPQIEKGIEF